MVSMRNKLQHLLNAILILAMALAAMGTSVVYAAEVASVPSGAPAEPVDACSPTGAETVVTDQADYAPEETVHITGGSYAASCEVTVRVTRPDGSIVVGNGSFAPGSDVVTTSPAGDLTYDYILNGIAGTYLIEVVGAAGQVLATTSFTDGTIRVYATGLGFAVYDILYTQRTDCTGPGQSHVGRGLGPNAFTSYTASATQSLKLIATYTSNSGIPFSHWSSDGSPFTNLGVFPYVNIAGFAICVPGFAGTGVRNYYAHFAAAPPPPPPPPTDSDGDGISDITDNCPLVANTSQTNTDGDPLGDACDPDDDNDGVADASDVFPLNASESVDTDGDGIGNNADTDDDNDGVADASDAFPFDASESVDTDGDGIGDNADPDDDNDGVADASDAFPFDASESVDTDGDGIGNNADTDDDNDGQSDADESTCGSNPLDASSRSVDNDGDGSPDCVDPDDDNDSVLDNDDNCSMIVNTDQENYDGDGLGDVCDPDDDNDGVLDVNDAIPQGSLLSTVILGGVNSGVPNYVFADGTSFNDLITQAAASATSQGQFLSAVSNLTNQWKKAGLITGAQKGAITSSAARSRVW